MTVPVELPTRQVAPAVATTTSDHAPRERLIRQAKALSWMSRAWMTVEGAASIIAALAAGSIALLGFGLDSAIEALASIIVIWRFTRHRRVSEAAERRAQQLVAISFFLLAPLHRPGRDPHSDRWYPTVRQPRRDRARDIEHRADAAAQPRQATDWIATAVGCDRR